MKAFKSLSTISMITLMAVASVGCGKGPKGDPGQNGSLGDGPSGKLVQTINCNAEITTAIAPYTFLNGLEVQYNAAITEAGDVYANAAIVDYSYQITNSAVYAKNQSGSQNAKVVIRFDPTSTDEAEWTITHNRVTGITKAVYHDPGVPAPDAVLTFNPAACISQIY